MEYRTGDIIKARMDRYPFIFHYGIVVVINGKVNIIHNTPDEKNEYGGNIVCYTPEKFFSTRQLISIQHTKISKERILKVVEQNKSRPFNLLTFNCEHFIYEIKDGIPSSPQVRYWLFNIVGFLLIITTLLNKVKAKRLLLFSKG